MKLCCVKTENRGITDRNLVEEAIRASFENIEDELKMILNRIRDGLASVSDEAVHTSAAVLSRSSPELIKEMLVFKKGRYRSTT